MQDSFIDDINALGMDKLMILVYLFLAVLGVASFVVAGMIYLADPARPELAITTAAAAGTVFAFAQNGLSKVNVRSEVEREVRRAILKELNGRLCDVKDCPTRKVKEDLIA